MKTSIVRTDIWKDEELYKLHLDSKLVYLFILSHPDRGNFYLFPWNKRVASMYTGLTQDQIEVALDELTGSGFVDVYNGYIAILKEHFSVTKNRYSQQQEDDMLTGLPADIYAHYVDKKQVPHEQKKAKKPKETKPDEIKKIIDAQPEVMHKPLMDFVSDRLERKKPATTGAVRLWVSKLNKMYPNNYVKQSESIYQSIERGWHGLFEVKASNDRTSENREFM